MGGRCFKTWGFYFSLSYSDDYGQKIKLISPNFLPVTVTNVMSPCPYLAP